MESEKKGIIYGMKDPRSGEVRYIGKTIQQLELRVRGHLKPHTLQRCDTHLTRWLRQLRSEGLKPIAFVIEEVSIKDLDKTEVFWIAHYKSLGAKLVNIAPGGTGGPTRKGYKNSPEHTKRLHEGLAHAKANGLIPSTPRTPEWNAKIADARKGMKFTKQHRANISAGKKGKKQDPDVIAKRRGIPCTEQHKEKIRQGIAKLTWEQVDEIRELLQVGELSNSQIGKLYGLSPRAILCIKKEETWKPQYHPKNE